MDKQTILDEIRRTAATNAGQPLGALRFTTETGIKETDWNGKFWARWGDALQEAGFEPNKWIEGYDEGLLIECLIRIMRDLGRVPTYRELLLRSRTDPTLPAAKTFAKRLGLKHERLNKIRAFCGERPEYSDVLAMCGEAPGIGTTPVELDAPAGADGFVYMLRSGRFYKIGRTNALGRRERELAIQLPEKTATVHTIATDDPVGVEGYWHKRFAARRKNGEFFELTAADVRAFKRWRRI